MEILTAEQHLVLGFIAACNRTRYSPTVAEVELWLSSPEPWEAEYRIVRRDPLSTPNMGFGTSGAALLMGESFRESTKKMIESMHPNIYTPRFKEKYKEIVRAAGLLGSGSTSELVRPEESVVDHLIRLRWVEDVSSTGSDDAELRVTDLGLALFRDRETETEAVEDVSVVVLGRGDPLAYPMLIGQLGAAGPGLLVDPYLKLEDLHRVVVTTQLTRLLITGQPSNRVVIGAVRAYLDTSSPTRRVEVRSSTQLHDRVLIADDGAVTTLGTSMNGVGKKTTVLTPMPSPANETLREEYKQIWDAADLVGPQRNEEEDQQETNDESA